MLAPPLSHPAKCVKTELHYKLGIRLFISSMLPQIMAMLLDMLKTRYLIEKGEMVSEYLQGGLTAVGNLGPPTLATQYQTQRVQFYSSVTD